MRSLGKLFPPARLSAKARRQLRRGTAVEMEHTRSRKMARTIASHHLVELPDYYTRLARMERNPPKLDRVAIRYASRLVDMIISGIKSGKIKGDTLYEEKGLSFRGHWEYGLKIGKRPVNLTVISPAYEGSIFVPDERHLPVQIKAPGWKIPDRSMLIHEIIHYLQVEHGQFHGTARGTEVADYLDQTNERDAYFAQLVADTNLKRVTKPANTVKTYFTKRGLWQAMKAQTRQHHIDRLTDLLALR